MRVAIVAGPHVPVPPVKYGGSESIIYHLIKGLQEEGHEPILLGAGNSKVECELVPIVDKAISFPIKKKDVPAHNQLIAEINAKTERLLSMLLPRIDIIHSHGFDLNKFQNFPNVTTLHSPITFENLDYYTKHQNLYYISISQNQQGAYPDLKYAGVVYNGEDPSPFPLVSEPEDYLCFLGRFDREKNPHLAIQLAINLGMKIKVAGKIDHLGEGYFEEEIAPYFTHPNVEYLGELGFEEKIELISKAKCNLHPTGFREPFGLTVLEAAFCGTPTLAINRGSMPELIEEGRSGVLVEDFIEGYHRIEECFEMDRLYIAKRARSLFNYKTMTRQYLKAYETVLHQFSPRRSREHILRQLTDKERYDVRLRKILTDGKHPFPRRQKGLST
jgi:glycosyltransferase involved in cell wall biosynthesis